MQIWEFEKCIEKKLQIVFKHIFINIKETPVKIVS